MQGKSNKLERLIAANVALHESSSSENSVSRSRSGSPPPVVTSANYKKPKSPEVMFELPGSGFPSAKRNIPGILAKWLEIFDTQKEGRVLEVASGNGVHLKTLSENFPKMTFEPSELAPLGLQQALIDIDHECAERPNVKNAISVDLIKPFESWHVQATSKAGQYSIFYASNICHIAEWQCSVEMLRSAGLALRDGGMLLVYGAFKVKGNFVSANDATFDSLLRDHNSEWGVRDVEALAAEGEKYGLKFNLAHDMPSNNFMLQFTKVSPKISL